MLPLELDPAPPAPMPCDVIVYMKDMRLPEVPARWPARARNDRPAARRKEDARFLTGAGRFTDDLQLEGQAYAAMVRSPHAHARIERISIQQAQKMPGVLGVFTGADCAADGCGRSTTRRCRRRSST